MIKELLAYQETDKLLRAIEVELSNSEERKKMLYSKKFLESAPETLEKLENKSNEIMAVYENLRIEKEKLGEQETEIEKAMETADENGVNYLLKKSEELINRIKNLEETSAKILSDAQSVIKEYADTKTRYKQEKDSFEENKEKYSKLKESKQEEVDKIKAELDKLSKKVDKDLMEKYLEKRNGKDSKFFPILYEVSGGVCGACNMELSMEELSKLKNGQIIECYQCRRLLYKSVE